MWYLLFCLHLLAAYSRAISRTSLFIFKSTHNQNRTEQIIIKELEPIPIQNLGFFSISNLHVPADDPFSARGVAAVDGGPVVGGPDLLTVSTVVAERRLTG